jgi:hypothetical protein
LRPQLVWPKLFPKKVLQNWSIRLVESISRHVRFPELDISTMAADTDYAQEWKSFRRPTGPSEGCREDAALRELGASWPNGDEDHKPDEAKTRRAAQAKYPGVAPPPRETK